MLTKGAPAAYPDAWLVQLRFQGRHYGYQTDDLVCELEDAVGNRANVLLQVKLQLKASHSHAQFAGAIAAAWYDFQDVSLFKRSRDRLVIAYDNDIDGSIRAAAVVTTLARSSKTPDEFIRKSTTKGMSSDAVRQALKEIREVVTAELEEVPEDEALHLFLGHVWFLNHSVAKDETTEVVNVLSLVAWALGEPWRSSPRSAWAELIAACQQLNHTAASVGPEDLGGRLSPKLLAAFEQHRRSPVARLRSPPVDEAQFRLLGAASDVRPGASAAEIRGDALGGVQAGLEEARTRGSQSIAVNRLLDGFLDSISDKIRNHRYEDALELVKELGRDLNALDAPKRAIWYLRRGICRLHLFSLNDAASDFLRAAELFPDDERTAAAKVRALLIRGEFEGALAAGRAAAERFPSSLTVWTAWAQARVECGEELRRDDIPPEYREEADACQIVANSQKQAGNWDAAVSLALRSLHLPGASFYTRTSALLTVLERATRSKVAAFHGLVDADTRTALKTAAREFEPLRDRLWAVQGGLVQATASNLGLALIICGEAQEALRMVRDAYANGVRGPHLLRIELEALRALDSVPEMLAIGRERLNELPEEGLVLLAQSAANVGDAVLVEVIGRALAKLEAQPEAVEILKALRWQALWNAGDHETARREALATDLLSLESLPLVASAVRVLHSSHADIAERALTHAEELVEQKSTPEEHAMLADLLFDVHEYQRAAPHYEQVAPIGHFSDLHVRLLTCYIRTDRRQRAKGLIQRFPDGWLLHDGARALAIELAQDAGDWSFLRRLADAQLKRFPREVSSWLLQYLVAIRTLPAAKVRELLTGAPLELDGSIRQTAQLAAQELRFGLAEKGMQRIYRLRRLKSLSTESASAVVNALLGVLEELPDMENCLGVIAPGTHVLLRDEAGAEVHLTVDPACSGDDLPESEEFKSSRAPEVQRFLGKRLGDVVVLEGVYAMERVFTVERIESAYRRLLNLAFEQLRRALSPVPGVEMLTLRTDSDGEPDLREIHARLKQQREHIRDAFGRYVGLPLTVGMLCRLIGCGPLDLVRAWPSGEGMPTLYVASGTSEESDAAMAQLKGGAAGYLIDAATLTELTMLDAAHSLGALPKVFVTADTRDVILRALAEAELARESGRLVDVEGEVRFVESTEFARQQNRQQIRDVLSVVDRYCEVIPAYGPETPPDFLARLEPVLQGEERAVLRAAIERNLSLLTIDGRLRGMAGMLEVSGISPQPLLRHAAEQRAIAASTYSHAIAKMFVMNRTFVRLGANDILMMCSQGTPWARVGLLRFKRYLASTEVNFQSVLLVASEFVALVAEGRATIAALAELLRHLVEGLLRHKEGSHAVVARFEGLAEELGGDISPNPYPPLRAAELQARGEKVAYFKAAVHTGAEWAEGERRERPIRLHVHHVCTTPVLAYGDS